MRIAKDRNVLIITIITVCVLATALRLVGVTSHTALSQHNSEGVNTRSLSSLTPPDEPARLRASESYGKLPLSFEVNQGQTDSEVKFLSRGSGYNLFLTATEAVLSL